SVGAQTGLCDAFGKCAIDCGPGQGGCDDNNPCTTDLCDPSVSKCMFTPVADGTPTPGVQQIAGDCHVRQCIMGADQNGVDDTDLPVSASDCVIPTCAMGTPSQPSKGAGAGCNTGALAR